MGKGGGLVIIAETDVYSPCLIRVHGLWISYAGNDIPGRNVVEEVGEDECVPSFPFAPVMAIDIDLFASFHWHIVKGLTKWT